MNTTKAYAQPLTLEQQRGNPDEMGQFHSRCQRIVMDKSKKKAKVCNRLMGNRCLRCFQEGKK